GAPSRAASAGPSPRAWPPHSDPVLRRPPQSPATDEPGRHPSPPGLPHVPARRPNPDAMPPPQASFLSRKSRLLKNYRLPTAEIPVRRSLPQAVGITVNFRTDAASGPSTAVMRSLCPAKTRASPAWNYLPSEPRLLRSDCLSL